jgi:ParB family transcriptional regulator, chromosome partitioning protein
MPSSTVPAAEVRQVRTSDIEPNPHNPRRLFDEEPMQILKESIEKLGILVPITVYQERKRRTTTKPFVILDGERRWRCAVALKLQRLPAIVVEEPSEAQNILTMFHIHNLREGWQLMPTALKLQILMDQLGTHNERKLGELTKLSISQIRRCKILLTYPKSFQNLMLAPQSERMKADFFIELQRIRKPALEERFPPWINRGDAKTVRIMLEKYMAHSIVAVTDFRKLAETYRASVRIHRRGQFMRRFDAFLEHPERGIDDVAVPGATFAREAKEIKRSVNRLLTQLGDLELDDISADVEVVALLRELRGLLDEKLEEALLLEVRS